MRILILNHNLAQHGAWFRAWPIAAGMARLGWDVAFATVSPRRLYRVSHRKEAGATIWETPRWTWPGLESDDGWGPLSLVAGLRLARRERFDWVYSFSHAPNCYLPALAAIKRDARLAVDWCDDYAAGVFPQREALRAQSARQFSWRDAFRRAATGDDFPSGHGPTPVAERIRSVERALIRPLKWTVQRAAERVESRCERSILLRAEKITVISHELLEKAVEYGVDRKRVLLARSGADLECFAPRSSADARRRLGLPARVPLLAYVANYHPDERFLLEALQIVFARDPSVALAYTGPSFTDALARDPPLFGRLISMGRLPMADVPDVLAAGDIALIPMADTAHNRARCPQKLMDCLAAGRPIATCAVGETGRIFRERPGAGLAAVPSPEAFADAILQLLRAPLPEREAFARGARAAAEEEFSWPRAVEAIDRFLRL